MIRLFWGLLLCSANNSDKKGTTNDNTHRPFIHIYTDSHTYTYTSSYNLSRMKNILHNREIISSLVLGTLLVVAVADIVALWTKIDIYIPFFQLGRVILCKELNATIRELRNINIRIEGSRADNTQMLLILGDQFRGYLLLLRKNTENTNIMENVYYPLK